MHSVADPCRLSKKVGLRVCESEIFQLFLVPDLKFYNSKRAMSKKEVGRVSSISTNGYPKQSMQMICKV
jgi:hypothetical protein